MRRQLLVTGTVCTDGSAGSERVFSRWWKPHVSHGQKGKSSTVENYKVFAEELLVLFKDRVLRIDEETNASMVIPDLKRGCIPARIMKCLCYQGEVMEKVFGAAFETSS